MRSLIYSHHRIILQLNLSHTVHAIYASFQYDPDQAMRTLRWKCIFFFYDYIFDSALRRHETLLWTILMGASMSCKWSRDGLRNTAYSVKCKFNSAINRKKCEEEEKQLNYNIMPTYRYDFVQQWKIHYTLFYYWQLQITYAIIKYTIFYRLRCESEVYKFDVKCVYQLHGHGHEHTETHSHIHIKPALYFIVSLQVYFWKSNKENK